MAIAAGFVVDDAIIVLENISRHIEAGMPRVEAALLGAREVGFTVVSMSLSLIAVFIPILLMGGIVGRLFREFAVTLSIAILISMVVSLTTTPMMCAYVLRPHEQDADAGTASSAASERGFAALQRLATAAACGLVLRHPLATMLVFLATVILNIYLYVTIPKGFFPQQDTGRIVGGIRADQSISFQAMRRKFRQFMEIVREDPAIESVAGFTGGFSTNSGFVFATLKPLSERKMSADQVIARLRPKLAQVPGANLFLQAVQDIRVGGRQSNAQYQFTLQADSLPDLYTWGPKLVEALRQDQSVITDVDSDQQQRGLQVNLTIDRDAAARLGVSTRAHLVDALRRLRPAPGLDHLQCAEPVSRRHGGLARVLGQPRVAEGHLCQHHGRRDQRRAGDRRQSSRPRRWRPAPSIRSAGGAQPAHQRDRRQRAAARPRPGPPSAPRPRR